jgi:shikimate kinase
MSGGEANSASTASKTGAKPVPQLQDEVAYELERPVFLIGFMGAGKTSVARKLARMAKIASVDMDTYIERRESKRVKEIFADVGEDGFRAIETEVLYELGMARDPMLVSCGGGVVLREENRRALHELGFVVYLRVTAKEAASRISDLSTRPLFGDLENAQRVIDSRLPLYEEAADVAIDTVGRGSTSIAREVFDLLKKEGIMWQRK